MTPVMPIKSAYSRKMWKKIVKIVLFEELS